jgi:hypothetical protein
MSYQRGSLKKVERKEGMTWILRYRINGKEQTPLVIGLVSDFPTEGEANVEVDRLGLRVKINCTNPRNERIRFNELAEYYLKVEFDPEVTASPKSENTKPILDHYVRDFLIAEWGDRSRRTWSRLKSRSGSIPCTTRKSTGGPLSRRFGAS